MFSIYNVLRTVLGNLPLLYISFYFLRTQPTVLRYRDRDYKHPIQQKYNGGPGSFSVLSKVEFQFSSVTVVTVTVLNLRPHGLQHTRIPCPSPIPKASPKSCPLSWWHSPNISSSNVPFFSRLQSFPASWSFPMSQFFASGGQNIGASNSASVLPINTQDQFPLGLTGLISFQSKGLSRVCTNTTFQKNQFFWHSTFFMVQLSHPYKTTGKTKALTRQTFVGKVMSLIFNMLFGLFIDFLPRSKCLLISWLQQSSAVILEPPFKRNLSLFPLFPHLFTMTWWDWMPWS